MQIKNNKTHYRWQCFRIYNNQIQFPQHLQMNRTLLSQKSQLYATICLNNQLKPQELQIKILRNKNTNNPIIKIKNKNQITIFLRTK